MNVKLGDMKTFGDITFSNPRSATHDHQIMDISLDMDREQDIKVLRQHIERHPTVFKKRLLALMESEEIRDILRNDWFELAAICDALVGKPPVSLVHILKTLREQVGENWSYYRDEGIISKSSEAFRNQMTPSNLIKRGLVP